MKISRLLLGVGFVLLILSVNGNSQFYYGPDGPVPLKIDSSKVCLKLAPLSAPSALNTLLSSIDRLATDIPDNNARDGFYVCSLTTSAGYLAFLDSLQSVSGVYLVEPYYLAANDSAMLVGDVFCVMFDTSLSRHSIDSINTSLGAVIDRELLGLPNAFVQRNTDSSSLRLLELSNAFHDLPETEFAEPGFGVKIVISTIDLMTTMHLNSCTCRK